MLKGSIIKHWVWRLTKYLLLSLTGFITLALLGAVVYFVFFNSVSHSPKGPAAEPSLSGYNLETWEAQKTELQQAFLDNLYGSYPDPEDTFREVARKKIFHPELDAIAQIEQITYQSKGVERLHVILILPKNITKPVPLIIGQNFASNPNTFPFSGVDKPATPFTSMIGEPGGSDGGLMMLVKMIMGEYLVTPPLPDIIADGYGFAGFYPGEIVPDNAAIAPAYLEKVGADGAVMAWAWGFNRVAEILGQHPNINENKIAAWGHSRHGKAALIAAVYENQINLVLSHQSGTGGASLGRSGVGESIQAITDAYPHWFSPNYRQFANDPMTLPIDQHQLVALAAPTPVLLGNGQHDKWSDPQTAFRAAEAATPIYELYGVKGLDQDKLNQPNFKTHLTFHMRAGPHGTRKSDWAAFLEFLDFHF